MYYAVSYYHGDKGVFNTLPDDIFEKGASVKQFNTKTAALRWLNGEVQALPSKTSLTFAKTTCFVETKIHAGVDIGFGIKVIQPTSIYHHLYHTRESYTVQQTELISVLLASRLLSGLEENKDEEKVVFTSSSYVLEVVKEMRDREITSEVLNYEILRECIDLIKKHRIILCSYDLNASERDQFRESTMKLAIESLSQPLNTLYSMQV